MDMRAISSYITKLVNCNYSDQNVKAKFKYKIKNGIEKDNLHVISLLSFSASIIQKQIL